MKNNQSLRLIATINRFDKYIHLCTRAFLLLRYRRPKSQHLRPFEEEKVIIETNKNYDKSPLCLINKWVRKEISLTEHCI